MSPPVQSSRSTGHHLRRLPARQPPNSASAYTRVSRRSQGLDETDQRDELLANLGDSKEIVGEYQDITSGSQGDGERHGLSKLLEDAANGKVDVLVCSDLTRLTRRVTPEIIEALVKSGVRIVVKDGSEVGVAELVMLTLMNQFAKSESQRRSERIKAGIRAARERRKAAADDADARSGSE
ncbi:MAG: recombinase family protein [Pirellulaceae bacterium]|nr:recombinase family protein [Pirellulaceae bacterium]